MVSLPLVQVGADPTALLDQLNAWGAYVESSSVENRTAVESVQDTLKLTVGQAEGALNEFVGGFRNEANMLRR